MGVWGGDTFSAWDPLGHSHAVLWSHDTNGMGWTIGIEVYLQWDPLGYSHAIPLYIPMGNNVQWTSVGNTGHILMTTAALIHDIIIAS